MLKVFKSVITNPLLLHNINHFGHIGYAIELHLGADIHQIQPIVSNRGLASNLHRKGTESIAVEPFLEVVKGSICESVSVNGVGSFSI